MHPASAVDFSEYLWMGEEDVEAFEKDYELQLFQEEMMWLELEEMLDEEEQESVVYFCEPEQFCSDDDDFPIQPSECDSLRYLNPEAPAFVPLMA